MGGLIFIGYIICIIFITVTLLQEQFFLNEMITSSQMAS